MARGTSMDWWIQVLVIITLVNRLLTTMVTWYYAGQAKTVTYTAGMAFWTTFSTGMIAWLLIRAYLL